MKENVKRIEGSFRDPSGFLFLRDGILYRQVNDIYAENYDSLMKSGLYEKLKKGRLIVAHEEVESEDGDPGVYKTIKPRLIPFISHPWEWSFSQLKDAALLTLIIQKRALEFDMSLKDCSAFNVQFTGCRPIFIDTLSFEKYVEGKPWVAYGQFCRHFLGPLALMSYVDVRLIKLFTNFIDGIPLDLVSSLLPFKSRLNFGILSHVHGQAGTEKKFADKGVEAAGKIRGASISKMALMGIIDSLESTIKGLKWEAGGTEWADYYNDTNYSKGSFKHKKELVDEYIEALKPSVLWDLGANEGIFSRVSSSKEIYTAAFDVDPSAVEKNYRQGRREKEKNLLPLLMDLTCPSPSIGWNNGERHSLKDRGSCDTAMALALVHHLAISNNVPLINVASFMAGICRSLIIEFVPKDDSQVQRLLQNREDIFDNYNKSHFEEAFSSFFKIVKKSDIRESKRTLYMMERL